MQQDLPLQPYWGPGWISGEQPKLAEEAQPEQSHLHTANCLACGKPADDVNNNNV